MEKIWAKSCQEQPISEVSRFLSAPPILLVWVGMMESIRTQADDCLSSSLLQELLPLHEQQVHRKEESRALLARPHHRDHHIRRPTLSSHHLLPSRKHKANAVFTTATSAPSHASRPADVRSTV
ncbi:hypothetical protein BHE74_00058601 [Ensete ventricosum]|nr:hypothetical protein BHE74_00058601 [Ensete ventricosum]